MQSYKWMSNFSETIIMFSVFWSINWSNLINTDTAEVQKIPYCTLQLSHNGDSAHKRHSELVLFTKLNAA